MLSLLFFVYFLLKSEKIKIPIIIQIRKIIKLKLKEKLGIRTKIEPKEKPTIE